MIDFIGGTSSKLKNAILKLRGKQPRSVDETKLDKLKKRYEYKTIALKSNHNELKKGDEGIVLELIDNTNAFVEFKGIEDVASIPLNKLKLRR